MNRKPIKDMEWLSLIDRTLRMRLITEQKNGPLNFSAWTYGHIDSVGVTDTKIVIVFGASCYIMTRDPDNCMVEWEML